MGTKLPRARVIAAMLATAVVVATCVQALAGGPDFIFSENTKFHLLTPDAKLSTYAIDDPLVEGVACWYTQPEKGGLSGMLGIAQETSDVSLACRQYGPIRFKDKFAEGDDVFVERRSIFFKHLQIVRGCDAKRNVLIYMVYTDKLIEGSPKNSTSTVPVMPWNAATDAPRCGDFLKG
ncbi:MAG: CreA family protein [Acetobacteraceae bacterium]|nr:CreA family protein [Acetobacteraceae bacterium]